MVVAWWWPRWWWRCWRWWRWQKVARHASGKKVATMVARVWESLQVASRVVGGPRGLAYCDERKVAMHVHCKAVVVYVWHKVVLRSAPRRLSDGNALKASCAHCGTQASMAI
eukprot:2889418-Alexandrium_andersonii.AAC.1